MADDYSPRGLAESNLAHVLDLVPKVIDATYPLPSAYLEALAKKHAAIQFVAANGGLFLIGWNADGSPEVYDARATDAPRSMGGRVT